MNKYQFDKHLAGLGVCDKDKILVAVSGGMDSMCLLYGLINSSLSLNCSVAHMNFHLRGEDSNIDESTVREWCNNSNIELFVKEVDTVAYSRERSISIEMAARDLRYLWFRELMLEHGFKFLAIAHNANDNAETLILNLVRGTGIKGLCGISEKNKNIIRPLLCYTRAQIEKYVLNFKIPYRIDHTNLESDFARNRVRNEVFPQLKKINPSVIGTLNRNIKYFSMASGILDIMALEKKKQLFKNHGVATGIICIEELVKQEYWSYWLFVILQDYGFNSAQVEDISACLCEKDVRRYISDSHVIVKERGMLKVYPVKMLDTISDNIINTPGVIKFGDLELSLELKENSAQIREAMLNPNNGLFVSADNLVFPLLCRNMISGDKFNPLGMTGMKKVSDFFTDIKIDNILRNRIPILLNGLTGVNKNPDNQIICLPGFRIDSHFKVTSKTKTVLVIKSTVY